MFIGEIAALGTACLWGFSTYMHTNAAKLMGAWALILFRFPLVLFYNVCIALLFGIPWVFPSDSLPWIMLSGIIGLGIADTLLYQGATRIGARMGSVLWQMTPCVTAVIAYFTLGETLSLLNLSGMLIIICSIVYVIFQEQGAEDVSVSREEWRYGLMLVAVSVFALGISHVCIRKGLSYGIDPLMGSIARIAAALVGSWIMVLITGGHHAVLTRITSSKQAIKIVLVASFFGTTIGNWMAVFSMQYAKAGIAATLMGMSPLMVIAMSSIAQRKAPSIRVVFGVLCACAGSSLLFM